MSQYSRQLVPRWPTILGSLALLIGLFAVSPTQSSAIPVPGAYAFSSGLIGTFTSDGNKMTEWNFHVPLFPQVIWTNSLTSIPTHNNALQFIQMQNVLGIDEEISAVWNDPHTLEFTFVHNHTNAIVGELASVQLIGTPVPEPSTIFLTASGLLLLFGYVRWQQREAAIKL